VFLLQFFFLPLGQSNNNSETCAEFRIKYVGAIEKLKLSEGKSLEGPLDLINYIDVAQVKTIPFNLWVMTLCVSSGWCSYHVMLKPCFDPVTALRL
jgi:hypothetical protein